MRLLDVRIQILVAAVRNEVLTYYQRVCSAAGLRLDRVGLRPYANSLSAAEVDPQAAVGRVLLVDVGPSMTEIDVLREGRLVFSRAASVGIPQTLVSEPSTGSDEPEAGTYKVASEAGEGRSVASVVRWLMVEVTRSVEAYRTTDPRAPIDRIVVAGSVGIESQLAEAIG